jgi:undecaprenyl pyrophosphate phosphatase UppP
MLNFIKFNYLNKILNIIKISCEKNNSVSSTRIIAYIITVLVIIITILSLGAGIYIAISTKVIPNEIVIILGMLLTHQLTLLGINKYHETKQKVAGVEPKNNDVTQETTQIVDETVN